MASNAPSLTPLPPRSQDNGRPARYPALDVFVQTPSRQDSKSSGCIYASSGLI